MENNILGLLTSMMNSHATPPPQNPSNNYYPSDAYPSENAQSQNPQSGLLPMLLSMMSGGTNPLSQIMGGETLSTLFNKKSPQKADEQEHDLPSDDIII